MGGLGFEFGGVRVMLWFYLLRLRMGDRTEGYEKRGMKGRNERMKQEKRGGLESREDVFI